VVDRDATKTFTKDLKASDQYFRFGASQLEAAIGKIHEVSGSKLLDEVRQNGGRLTVGDVTFVLAESYGFCWGVERSITMAYEAKNFFPDKTIWVTNEIIHNPQVNGNLTEMGMNIVAAGPDGKKDFSGVKEGDVVVLPAFGASVDEMALFKERGAMIVDTTCPWVSKVWATVEKSKAKGHTSIIHGTYNHEETIATRSFAKKYIVIKDMSQAEYVAEYMLGNGNRDEFMERFGEVSSPGFDPDVDLERVGVSNQTTMLKGETELIGKLFERALIKKYGPQNIDDHFVSFNTICDATQLRQDAMYKMFSAKYEPPTSALYAELEGEQVGVTLQTGGRAVAMSSKKKEDATRGAATASADANEKIDVCLVVGGFNSSNTTHLVEIAEEQGVPGFHIDYPERIEGNSITHKPLSTSPHDAVKGTGLATDAFLPEGPVVIGVTSGASTPDSVVGESLKRILDARGLSA
jgi:4-hydroxy-3-methylbut-2-enyl diphosphate reductase